jgi:hypothetical protein
MIYYIKQDDTIWGCGDPECCGEYYKDLKESFVDMPEGVEITALALQLQIGGGPVLEFREATHLECLSWYVAYDEGYSEGYSEGH